jgi:hypothetical protein
MSATLLFATVAACACLSLFWRGIMIDSLCPSRRQVFRRDERVYWAVLALVLVLHQVAIGVPLVTTSATRWGFDLTLCAFVVLFHIIRFMDVCRAVKNQHAETEALANA